MDELIDYITNYIDNLNISLGATEQLGATFLILGYSKFFIGADMDILMASGALEESKMPDEIYLYGQTLSLIGYIILFIVSYKRYNELLYKELYLNDYFNLSSYLLLVQSYFLSVIANSLRVVAFTSIVSYNNQTSS